MIVWKNTFLEYQIEWSDPQNNRVIVHVPVKGGVKKINGTINRRCIRLDESHSTNNVLVRSICLDIYEIQSFMKEIGVEYKEDVPKKREEKSASENSSGGQGEGVEASFSP